MGSPPRVRGRVLCGSYIEFVIRITPARAGKSGKNRQYRDQKEDHPRACGEEGYVPYCPRRFGGSPPRVRGRVTGQILQRVDVGITPARAGKRQVPGKGSPAIGDHPRACGEEMYTV